MKKSPNTMEKIDTKMQQYWSALGEFVHAFSGVEVRIQKLLWQIAGTPEPTAKAIFSSEKVDQARSKILRIFQARQQEEPPILTRAFDQLLIINGTRNHILHYGAEMDDDNFEFFVSNEIKVYDQKKLHRFQVSPTTLKNMSADLEIVFHSMGWYSVYSDEARRKMLGHVAFLEELALLPWQYKPSPQPERRAKSPTHRSARKDPP